MSGHLAVGAVEVQATPDLVWQVLVDPDSVREYMFGSEVVTSWLPGSPILFRGEWEGKPYEDKGVIVKVDEPALLQYTHYSPLSGTPDVPESYHTLTFTLEEIPAGTRLTLTQDNNDTVESAEHSAGMWRQLLESVRTIAER
ncbi:MAG: SRPBCC domain-containing protein [Actinomycetota bacterium]